jgi:hypothetical protein
LEVTFKTNQLGFNSPAKKQPAFIPAGLTFGFEKDPEGGTVGFGLGPVVNGNGTGIVLQILCA